MASEYLDVDRAGNFQGQIMDFGLKEMESGSVAISVRAVLTTFWENEDWVDWTPYNTQAYGDLWIIKKDGTLNQSQVESLCKYAGWDGDIASISNGTWEPTACQFTITRETYRNQDQFKISFLNQYDRKPGALGTLAPNRVKELQAKFGSQLRATAGNAKRNSAPTAGKPPAPKPLDDANRAFQHAESNGVDCPV